MKISLHLRPKGVYDKIINNNIGERGREGVKLLEITEDLEKIETINKNLEINDLDKNIIFNRSH